MSLAARIFAAKQILGRELDSCHCSQPSAPVRVVFDSRCSACLGKRWDGLTPLFGIRAVPLSCGLLHHTTLADWQSSVTQVCLPAYLYRHTDGGLYLRVADGDVFCSDINCYDKEGSFSASCGRYAYRDGLLVNRECLR